MELSKQIAKQFRDVHFGGNWTYSNLKDTLEGITWQQATAKFYNFNTIAALVYHINYYISGVLEVFRGQPLSISDKYCYTHPAIENKESWDKLVQKVFTDAENFATELEKMPEEIFWKPFHDGNYGNYYRNIHGIIEHTHYHLGQIALLKKLAQQSNP